jgi:hypothetical protein
MINFFKTLKELKSKQQQLQNNFELYKLFIDNLLSKNAKDNAIYSAMGRPNPSFMDRGLYLLIEARDRGFFNVNNYFTTYNDLSLYRNHYYSDISENYRYEEYSDSLYIPMIGVDNYSCGTMCIYKKGVWGKVISATEINPNETETKVESHLIDELTERFNSETFIDNVCLSYRHDFGFLSEDEKDTTRRQCREWMSLITNNWKHFKK